MLETLINLKNNKFKRAATQHAGGDVTERLKKFLTGLSKTRHCIVVFIFPSRGMGLTALFSGSARSSASDFGRPAFRGHEREVVASRRRLERRPSRRATGKLEASVEHTR
jgi:hypothetical protein